MADVGLGIVERASRLFLLATALGICAFGCGWGEITQQDQYNKIKVLDKQGQKDPRDGGIEK